MKLQLFLVDYNRMPWGLKNPWEIGSCVSLAYEDRSLWLVKLYFHDVSSVTSINE